MISAKRDNELRGEDGKAFQVAAMHESLQKIESVRWCGGERRREAKENLSVISYRSDSEVSVCGTADLVTQQKYFSQVDWGCDSLKDETRSSELHRIILTASSRTPGR